jgi:hypothetical protein
MRPVVVPLAVRTWRAQPAAAASQRSQQGWINPAPLVQVQHRCQRVGRSPALCAASGCLSGRGRRSRRSLRVRLGAAVAGMTGALPRGQTTFVGG